MKPYRAKVAGSMLRPDYLLKARKGNAISFETQEEKQRLVAQVARQVWDD